MKLESKLVFFVCFFNVSIKVNLFGCCGFDVKAEKFWGLYKLASNQKCPDHVVMTRFDHL